MDLLTLIATCAPLVAPNTLKAVVLEESRGHPYAIHDGTSGRALFPATAAEAVHTARRLLADGSRIDAGLAQINSDNWSWLGLDVQQVFDPCANLAAGERVLLDAYLTAPYTLDAALSRYNTGKATLGIRNGYVDRVKAWLAAPPPARDYAYDGMPADGGERPPLPVQAAIAEAPAADSSRGAPLPGPTVPAWHFAPVSDGFGEGG